MNSSALSTRTAQNPPSGLSNRPAVQPARNDQESRNELNGANVPQPGRARKSRLKRMALMVSIVLSTLSLARLTYTWWSVGRFMESTDDAYVGGDVTVIAPKVAGFIAKLAVVDNQRVHAGDLLVKLDDRDYIAALAKANAAVAIQQAGLTNLDASRHLQEAVVAQAQATITADDAEIVRTRDDQLRFTQLLGYSAVSVQESQRADAAYKEAMAVGEKSRAALAAVQRQLEVIDTQKLQVQAALEQAAAERDLAQLNVGYTELRAPIDGTVGNRSAQVGSYAQVGSQLISLIPAHGLWVDANFKEDQLAHIRPGSPVTVKIDSIHGEKFQGHVVSISPATGAKFSVLPPENATGNFTKIVQRVTVRIAFDDEADAHGQLRPGLSVTAKVDTRSSEKAGM